MREIYANEIAIVSGGYDNDGYNFSLIVEASFACGLVGWALTGFTFNGGLIGFSIGAAYSSGMMLAKALDNQLFTSDSHPDPDSEVTPVFMPLVV